MPASTPRLAAVGTHVPELVGEVGEVKSWGRRSHASWRATLGALAVVVFCPLWIVTNWIALEHYGGSLRALFQAFCRQGPLEFIAQHAPRPNTHATVGYLAWVSFQAILYSNLPGPAGKGQMTPAGNILNYTTNGMFAWTLTHMLFVGASLNGILDPALIAKHWEGLLVAVNVYGLLLALFAQVKAYVAPSHPEDRKFTGSVIFDYFCGIELNPRFSDKFDFKLFYNGRPGIIAWTLIDLSWMAYQHQTFGYISKSMLLVNFFHFIYVCDLFYNEDWYLRTIDITHDHFGFTLAWGDTAFLPNLYTLQAQYLGRHPLHLSTPACLIILTIGLSAYCLFRSVNNQKNLVRSSPQPETVKIWGRPATIMRTQYQTKDGKTHESLLLTSGWWGLSRHANYLADLMLAWAMCATCGMRDFLPWSYFFFMAGLLGHRIYRDEERCKRKYGKGWEAYTGLVRYKLVPGLW